MSTIMAFQAVLFRITLGTDFSKVLRAENEDICDWLGPNLDVENVVLKAKQD